MVLVMHMTFYVCVLFVYILVLEHFIDGSPSVIR